MIPRWVPRVTLGIALGASAVSAYLTIAHYTSPAVLACAESGVVNCSRVTTSQQSMFLGVPVALLGLLWSVAMTGLCLPAAWRSRSPLVSYSRLWLAVLGVGFVLWLIYAELFIIRALCLWCSVVHLAAIALFALVVLYGIPEGGGS